jgi:hypothetical protein
VPSLRGHMVFISHLRDALQTELPAAGKVVADHWPAALMGSQGPDGWFFVDGAQRPSTHILDKADPSTWQSAMDLWFERYAHLRPGPDQSPDVSSFMIGYLSHLGLDIWGEEYQHPNLPAAARAAAPDSWYPDDLGGYDGVRASLRRLGEAPFPADRIISRAELDRIEAPAELNPDAVRRVTAGFLPALPLSDPWEISRISGLREMPTTPEAQASWEQDRAKLPRATDAQYAALLKGATIYTIDLLRRWW